MLGKRPTKAIADMAEPYKVWKEKPPGPEQRELQRMFDCKEINASATPDSVRKSTQCFNNSLERSSQHIFAKLKRSME